MKERINAIELLVFMLQNVDGDPFLILADILKPIIYQSIKQRYIRGFDREDFLQEANKVFVESINKYKFEEEMKFPQYFSMQLENHLNMLIRKETALKRRSIKEATSYDELNELRKMKFHSTSGSNVSPEESAIVQETLHEYISDLSSFEKEVFFFYIADVSYEEIARRLNCEKEKAQSAMYRCGVKLKKIIKGM